MKTILLPTDFSENARQSFMYAVSLFGKKGVKYVLMHSYDIPKRSAEVMVDSLRDGLGSEARQALDEEVQWFQKETQLPSISIGSVVSMGSVVDAVLNFIRETRTYGIAMGTQGASGLKEVFIGSNASSVINKVNLPVIAFPKGAQRTSPKSITLALDIKFPVDKERFLPLIELAQNHSANISVLSIHPEKEETDFASFREELHQALGDLFLKFVYKKSDKVAESIEAYMRLEHPDLLCLLPNRSSYFERLFKGSVTKKIAFHSKGPIMTLP